VLLSKALLAPYRLVFYTFLTARRTIATLRPGHGWMTWVTPEILVGGFLTAADVQKLVRVGVRVVINTTSELVEPVRALEQAGIEYLQVPCWDMRCPRVDDAERALELMQKSIEAGKRVYVHCASGAGRSVLLVTCYLALARGKSVEEAFAWIKERRPRASLSEVQRRFVEDFIKSRG